MDYLNRNDESKGHYEDLMRSLAWNQIKSDPNKNRE